MAPNPLSSELSSPSTNQMTNATKRCIKAINNHISFVKASMNIQVSLDLSGFTFTIMEIPDSIYGAENSAYAYLCSKTCISPTAASKTYIRNTHKKTILRGILILRESLSLRLDRWGELISNEVEC